MVTIEYLLHRRRLQLFIYMMALPRAPYFLGPILAQKDSEDSYHYPHYPQCALSSTLSSTQCLGLGHSAVPYSVHTVVALYGEL